MYLTISSSSFFEKTAIGIFILGFIAGITAGALFPTITQSGGGLYVEFEESFNTALMIYVWIGSFLSGATFLFFATVLQYFEIDLRSKREAKKNSNNIKPDKVEKVNEWI